MSAARPPPVDQVDRELAVREKARNVLIDAGAGTGKTTLIVSRFVELLAPSDASPGTPIERLVAVTFTRKAAGELRLRIREGLLRALADASLAPGRRALLRTALAGIDAAWIGTIHSFADRLLRLEPIAAGLSPSYDIVDDEAALVQEAWHEVLAAAEGRVLLDLVGGSPAAARALEAQQTILDACQVGLPIETIHREFIDWHGLEALFGAFVTTRDTPPPTDTPVPEVDWKAFRKLTEELAELVSGIGDESVPQRWLKRAADQLFALRDETDPVAAYQAVWEVLRSEPDPVRKGEHFVDDDEGWDAWKAWDGDSRASAVREASLRDELSGLFERWLAIRLMRASPVMLEAYERVKARYRVVDQVDLLLKLRNLLRDDLAVRRRLQGIFSHLFVDEFQDTDPLQAEVLLFLCEDGARATDWQEVVLAPGRLTLVGDPKQSIYRFRRADVAMYDQVRQKVAAGPHLPVRLRANFRSVSTLIEYFNDRFEQVLGKPRKKGQQFDAKEGVVFHAPLAAGLGVPGTTPVWVVPVAGEGGKVDEVRAHEADAWAWCLTWMVNEERPQVRDPVSGAWRPVQYGDVALLAHNTTNLGLLLDALDRHGVPWSARGGTLFPSDPLHQQFILGLRALANPKDGVAKMALFRPPFFAVDLADVALTERLDEPPAEVVARMQPVRELVEELRQRRFERPPGDTARDLLERSGFARHVATGPNGVQRLERLREVGLVLERTAAAEGLDFDGATARLRDWVDEPPQLDAPHPVGAEAVQVLTVYQAKGLEFPVVGLWDVRAPWKARSDVPPWVVSRDGRQWAVSLHHFAWAEPEDAELVGKELAYRTAERRRVVYVAGTRARDLLLVPRCGEEGAPGSFIADLLTEAGPKGTVRRLGAGQEEVEGRPWCGFPQLVRRVEPPVLAEATASADDEWVAAASTAGRSVLEPVGVSVEAHRRIEALGEDDDGAERPVKRRQGRYGTAFGLTVHRALGLVLMGAAGSPEEAVARAGEEFGLVEHLEVAVEDVRRTLVTLAGLGVTPESPPGSVALEYPVAGSQGALLLGGSIDLLVVQEGLFQIIDFKTDRAPVGPVNESHPAYVAQVSTYAALLERADRVLAKVVRKGLLFTETGRLLWV